MHKTTRKLLLTLSLALLPVPVLAQTDTTAPSTTDTTTPAATDTTTPAATDTTSTTTTDTTTNDNGFDYGWLGLLGLAGLAGLTRRQPPVVHVDPQDTARRP